jgi:2-polyprenyl-6-methoxyphenol hydroxylase-like FAD-dependent oxidoreductase
MGTDATAAPSTATTCAIVGGGPAGMALGRLLARAGVTVTVLERHADFLPDFRGDTVHPSTLTLLDELRLCPGLPPCRSPRCARSGSSSTPGR